MFSIHKQVFIVFLSFSGSLTRKCVSLNDKQCTVISKFINLNPFETEYYQSMVGLDKCSGSCNVLSPEICISKKKKKRSRINVK